MKFFSGTLVPYSLVVISTIKMNYISDDSKNDLFLCNFIMYFITLAFHLLISLGQAKI